MPAQGYFLETPVSYRPRFRVGSLNVPVHPRLVWSKIWITALTVRSLIIIVTFELAVFRCIVDDLHRSEVSVPIVILAPPESLEGGTAAPGFLVKKDRWTGPHASWDVIFARVDSVSANALCIDSQGQKLTVHIFRPFAVPLAVSNCPLNCLSGCLFT